VTGATLVWLESTAPGTAARTHLDGTRERIVSAGISVDSVVTSVESRPGAAARLRRLATLIRRARASSKDQSVLVARWHPFLAFVSPLWLRRGRRVVLLVQGNDHTTYETHPWFRRVPFSRRIMRASLRNASSWLVLNEGLRDWLTGEVGLPAGEVVILPTGVSEEFRRARGSASEFGSYVVFFGSLAPWQGVQTLLDAANEPEWPSSHKLLIVGAGAMEDVVSAAQSNRVVWLGRQPTPRTAAIVAAATCSVCPKLDVPSMANSTTPFKMLESVAAGVPVVASDIPAQVRMVRAGQYGLLARANDPSDLARQVRSLCEDRALRERLAAAARETGDNLGWDAGSPLLAAAIRVPAPSVV
jgi:glycosyltransferase involved in cell wall biosynthesis